MAVSTQNLSQQELDMLGTVAAWARQTIAFAISVRNSATTSSLDDEGQARVAGQEADRLTDDIWYEAAQESKTLSEAVVVYAAKVFAWCYTHMNP